MMFRSLSLSQTRKEEQISVPFSFSFCSCIAKTELDNFMRILMRESNITIFGYNKGEDQYWAKTNIKGTNTEITILLVSQCTFTSILLCSESSYLHDLQKIFIRFQQAVYLLETKQSFYRKKYIF